MESQNNNYEQAFVPEHLTALTIDILPLDEVYYIEPDDRDTYETTPGIFVADNRNLKMSRDYSIDMDDGACEVPVGRVAIMRVALIDPEALTVRDAFIADLRFIENHQLTDMARLMSGSSNQEESMYLADVIGNSVAFNGFIAPEADFEIDQDIPEGTLYGPESLHPHLEFLRGRTNEVMERYLQREAQVDEVVAEEVKTQVIPKPVKQASPPDSA